MKLPAREGFYENIYCGGLRTAERQGCPYCGQPGYPKNNSVLGLATGSTPEGMYRELVRLNLEGTLDFSGVVTFNLDEYIGLPPGTPRATIITCTTIFLIT
jgi:hypothetical protein